MENFKKHTDSFAHIGRLEPEEILYLNMCTWLEPQARKINSRLKYYGDLKIVEMIDGVENVTEIYEFDLFHSLLGEMLPGSSRDSGRGGHLFIPGFTGCFFAADTIEPIGGGFFYMNIESVNKKIFSFKPNSYFPSGTDVVEAIKIIEDAIQNYKFLHCVTSKIKPTEKIFEIIDMHDRKFIVRVNNGVAKFYPKKL